MSLILPGVNFFRRNLSSVNGLKVLFFGTDDFGVSILDALNKLRFVSTKSFSCYFTHGYEPYFHVISVIN